MPESVEEISRSAEPAGMPEGFRAMMRGFPTSVAIVTATDLAGQPWGMTCSSVCSVTLEPPTLLVCLRATSPTLAAILARGVFAVNLLHEGAQTAAELFASGDPERFNRVRWQRDREDVSPHLSQDSHAVADCRIGRTFRVGDHMVVFGEVVGITQRPGRRPLLYGLRQYGGWPHGLSVVKMA